MTGVSGCQDGRTSCGDPEPTSLLPALMRGASSP